MQQPAKSPSSFALTPWSPQEEERIWSALSAIPARGYDNWRTIGMALQSLDWVRPDGTSPAFELFDDWSATEGEQYSLDATEKKWASFGKRTGIGIGTLFHIAEEHGWLGNAPQEYVVPTPSPFAGVNGSHAGPTLTPTAFVPRGGSPLIELNQKYSVIGDVGGKCMVMAWVPSSIDSAIKVPSFQSFHTFQERYANRYVQALKKKKTVVEEPRPETPEDEQEPRQLGAAWLKWPKRQTYERLELLPGGAEVLPNGALNLWRGFGVEPRAGSWDRMKAHIALVLADRDPRALNYIIRWMAWSVQYPGQPAGAALVLRGGQGTGKGVFARTLCQIFGQHGVQLYNARHMVGFNAILRSCLLLYADEAFWAGDKQGESTLKGLITEPFIMIEGKGVNAEMWRNRLHIVMTSNADWVVPAGHDSRRYAVFDVAETRKQDNAYFTPLYAELDNGGREAMLYDLLRVELGDWQPREIVKNKALEDQKARSLDPLSEWYLNLLSEGRLPSYSKTAEGMTAIPSGVLLSNAQSYSKQLSNTLTATRLGLFLRDAGCIKRANVGKAGNNGWLFPGLKEARKGWENKFGAWSFDATEEAWRGY